MTKEFDKKVFIVTGASSGIGKATAQMALERGAKVVTVARREAMLIPDSAHGDPSQVLTVQADLMKEEDRKRVIDDTLSRFGGVDVLVNAAGIIANGTIENTT